MEATEEELDAGGADDRGRPFRSELGLALIETRRLCRWCVERLPIDAASVSVRGGSSSKELLYATDEVIAKLDDLQFVLGEGPCRDAYFSRSPVLEADLSSTTALMKWPGFTPEAFAAGAGAVFAFPLQLGAVPFGILEMYRATPGELSGDDVATAVLLAETGARQVLDDFHDAGLAGTRADPDPAFGHVEVPQATGMIAVQQGISIPAALVALRAAAYAQNRLVIDVARDVLTGHINFRLDP